MSRFQAAARLHGLAGGVRTDVTDDDPLVGVDPLPDAVLVAINDRDDRLLHSAARRGIPLVDIARWLDRVEVAHQILAADTVTAPVVLASGWIASAAAVTVAAYGGNAPADHVGIDIPLSLADKTGCDSATGFVDVHRPFELWENGEPRTVRGMPELHAVTFGDGRTWPCRLFSSPEQATLVTTGHARGLSVCMAFDHRPPTRCSPWSTPVCGKGFGRVQVRDPPWSGGERRRLARVRRHRPQRPVCPHHPG
ncbi:hypothetical protein ACFW2I_34980 [Streptomyces nigra]|uniref:hypothetical protein n=1 Tax=Streptomyces nigra TaxID=1827580 RepID=UPI0036B37D76